MTPSCGKGFSPNRVLNCIDKLIPFFGFCHQKNIDTLSFDIFYSRKIQESAIHFYKSCYVTARQRAKNSLEIFESFKIVLPLHSVRRIPLDHIIR